MKIREDARPTIIEDVFFDLCIGENIDPEAFLADPEDIKEIRKAAQIIADYVLCLYRHDLIEN